MSAVLIDGKAEAQKLRRQIAAETANLVRDHGFQPGLAVVLVGDDPASHVYVRNKAKQTVEAGMRSFEHRLPGTAGERDLLDLVSRLNDDPHVDGILVQLPLPRHIDPQHIIEAIDPDKDVDGFHPVNSGRVAAGHGGMVPCTPLGALHLIQSVRRDIAGLEAVVVGRSNIVGKPMAALLLGQSCTVTIAHSRTDRLADICARADILVAAVGRPQMIRGAWLKRGAIVIDVGINRVSAAGGTGHCLVGDVAFDEALPQVGAITPVPGGVGPMTIACLLRNTVEAACRRRRIARRDSMTV